LNGITIRPAVLDDIERCVAIEIAAASRFAAIDMPELVALTETDPYMREHGAAHAAAGALFVAEQGGEVAGYAALDVIDGLAHLCEIDTHPDHAGQGIGRALITRAEQWAHANGLPAITLTTFIDVPWNGPWYERLGFRPYADSAWGPGHQRIWQGQLASALDCSRRFMMIKALP
jgi:GNAT superfamily N-acetyltransferase